MIRDSDDLEFARLAEALRAAPTPAATADEIVEYVRQQLDATFVGLTLIRAGNRPETIAATDPLAKEADRLERELGEGPRHEKNVWHEGTVLSSELADERRWSRWASAVVDLGIVSVLAAELTSLDAQRIGSINFFWTWRREFTDDDVAFADLFARYAALALAQSMAADTLNTTLDSRELIGQAQGILMERHDLDENLAFEVLRRYCQDHNVSLRTAAEHLTATPPTLVLRQSTLD
jgi:GAF domain-containing protein